MSDRIGKILLVRTDRIGDLVLSLPMLPVLRQHYPHAEITFLVRQYTQELVDHHPCVDEILLYEQENKILELWGLLKKLRKRVFDLAIVPYPRFRVALLITLAGIPVRVGSGYRWYSFLFNRRVYEHRKDSRKHEAEYNLNLLKSIGIDPPLEPRFDLVVSEECEKQGSAILLQKNIGENEQFAILHPGSGGSARDWKPERFAELGDLVKKDLGIQVLITGGPKEHGLVMFVSSLMKEPNSIYLGKDGLGVLASILRKASVLVSNSTGPLHIAAAIGTPVIGFYPPIRQCSPVRWGPYTKKKRVFEASNKECSLCQGGPCRSNVCMDQIKVADVFHAVKEFINK